MAVEDDEPERGEQVIAGPSRAVVVVTFGSGEDEPGPTGRGVGVLVVEPVAVGLE